jgi:hypothetical protein
MRVLEGNRLRGHPPLSPTPGVTALPAMRLQAAGFRLENSSHRVYPFWHEPDSNRVRGRRSTSWGCHGHSHPRCDTVGAVAVSDHTTCRAAVRPRIHIRGATFQVLEAAGVDRGRKLCSQDGRHIAPRSPTPLPLPGPGRKPCASSRPQAAGFFESQCAKSSATAGHSARDGDREQIRFGNPAPAEGVSRSRH